MKMFCCTGCALDDDDDFTATTEMQKVADAADISVLFFSAGANFWAIFGHFWSILAILGHFWANLGHFLVLIFFGQKCISAIFITFCISERNFDSISSVHLLGS